MKKTRPVKPRRELFLRNNRVEYVNKQNEKKEGTLIFPKTFVTRDIAFWGRTIFLDESKFNIFNSNGRNYVWRGANTAIGRSKCTAKR